MRFTGCAALLLLGFAGALRAQEVVAVLKGEDGHGFNTRGWPIAKWDGYWVHRDEGNATNLYLFHENGDFAQMLGREGQGPMEFQSISDAVVVGDSLYVHDSMNARLTVIGPDLELVRDFQFPARPTDIDVAGDRLVFAGMFYDREKAGRAAFFIQPTSGAPITGGFDAFDIIPIEGGMGGWRQLAVRGDNITTLSHDGLLKTYDFAGRLRHEVMTQKPDGWTVSVLDPEYREKRGDGEIFASYVDKIIPASGGLVWVSFIWPHEDYRNRVRTVQWRDRVAYRLDIDGFQSRVDLIDPTDGSVHQSIHVDEYVASLVDQGYIASARYDDLDRVTITIRRLPEIRKDTP
jgi:hypothetical protein